ncbi:hypothetical protein [Nocardia sp. NPDC003345]
MIVMASNMVSLRTRSLKSEVLRPSRLNAAGWCIYCCGRHCEKAACIAWYAGAVWETCTRCGGSEYVDGHLDPETSTERCDCTQGLTETGASGAVAEVIGFPGARERKAPEVIGYSAQGRPVIRDHLGKVSEVFDIDDPEQWF